MEQPPIFVKIEKYKELVSLMNAVDQKVKDANSLLQQVQQLKAEEDAQLAAWTATLDDVKARTAELRKNLSKA